MLSLSSFLIARCSLPLGVLSTALNSSNPREKMHFIFLSLLPQLCKPQAVVTILRLCGSFCKLAHLALLTPPPPLSVSVFREFNNDVLHCFELSAAIELTLPAAKQATLNLSHGGLGLRSLYCHATAAYILTTSVPSESYTVTSKNYLLATVNAYNTIVSQLDAISVESVLDVPPRQYTLLSCIEDQFPFFRCHYCDKGQIAGYFCTSSPCMAQSAAFTKFRS